MFNECKLSEQRSSCQSGVWSMTSSTIYWRSVVHITNFIYRQGRLHERWHIQLSQYIRVSWWKSTRDCRNTMLASIVRQCQSSRDGRQAPKQTMFIAVFAKLQFPLKVLSTLLGHNRQVVNVEWSDTLFSRYRTGIHWPYVLLVLNLSRRFRRLTCSIPWSKCIDFRLWELQYNTHHRRWCITEPCTDCMAATSREVSCVHKS